MFDQLINAAAQQYKLDPALFRRQIMAESGMNPNAVSPKGAAGLGQLMPGTAREMGVTNVRDPQQNINASAGYMRRMLDQFGQDPRKAYAAYNWGPGNLARAGGDVSRAPAETQGYLRRILGAGDMQASMRVPVRVTGGGAVQAPPALPAAPVAPQPAPAAPVVATPDADLAQLLAMAAGGGGPGGANGLASLLRAFGQQASA